MVVELESFTPTASAKSRLMNSTATVLLCRLAVIDVDDGTLDVSRTMCPIIDEGSDDMVFTFFEVG